MKTNNYIRSDIKGAISAVSMLFISPVTAIENPIAETLPKQKNQQLQKSNQAEVLKGKKVAVLGVGGSPVSASMASHLGIEVGEGMTLVHIDPESAAAKAGLQVHDVMTKFDGHPISDQQSLRDAVLNRKPGDQVTVEYIHRSERKEVEATLGGRVVMFDNNRNPQINPKPSNNGLNNFHQADRRLIEKRMQKHMQEMRNQLHGHAGMELDLHKILQSVSGGAGVQGIHDALDQMKQGINQSGNGAQGSTMSFSSSSSITHRDREGSVTMKNMNGLEEIVVKDLNGKVIYEGPYQTAEDKAAIPDEIRQRLVEMNLSDGSSPNVRLHIQGSEVDRSSR